MSIEVACSQCSARLKVNDRAIGRRVRCPECGTLVLITEAVKEPELPLEELEVVPEEEPPLDQAELIPLPSPVAPPPIVKKPKPQPRAALRKLRAPPRSVIAAEAPLLPPPRPHPEDLIDMTAMVDIVFFLLIFFLVTSLQALESVMDLPTPQAAESGAAVGRTVSELENDPNFITVRIEDDDSIWVEDTQVFNDQDLGARLRAARQASASPRSLLVLGDADASHGAAVRVFDAGAGAGVSGISLLVQEKAEPGK